MQTKGKNYLPFYKRTFLINRQYQLGFVVRVLGLVLAGAAVFMAMFYLLSQGMMSVSYENYDIQVGQASKMLLPQVLTATLIYLVLTGLTMAVLTILLSHRVVGPLYRIARTMEKMLGGNLTLRVRLRKKDSPGEIVEALNRLMDEYAARIRQVKSGAGAVLERVEKMKISGASGSGDMEHFEAELRDIVKRLAFFQTEAEPIEHDALGAHDGHEH